MSEPLTPEALDTIERELRGEIADAVWSVLEDRLEDDIHLDLNDSDESQRFRALVKAVTSAAIVPIRAELRRLRTENEEQRGKLDQINAVLSELDLGSKITREGTAWGSILREALALSSRAALTGEATT